jgi:hypothetical protein
VHASQAAGAAAAAPMSQNRGVCAVVLFEYDASKYIQVGAMHKIYNDV